jgi:glycosyltransferase involved in cell wall biosynthesis
MAQNFDLNVMHVILNLDRAGAQEVVRTLAEYQQQMGCSVTVCAFYDGPLRTDIEQLGIKVEILTHSRHSVGALPLFLADLWQIRRKLALLVKKYRINVIQTHLLIVLDFVVLSLRGCADIRVVLWTIHNVDFLPSGSHWSFKFKNFVYRVLYRLLASSVDGFVAVSDKVKDAILAQVGPAEDKVITIPNGVDVARYQRSASKKALCATLGLDESSHLMLTVGRLTKQKGHCYLIDAAVPVVSSFPNAHFLFAGDGELRGALQQQVQQVSLEEHIHFLGIRKDIPDLLAAVDAFVLPSLWEGLSIALLEAMAAAKPIVATSVSGTTQVMTSGETGIVVPPYNSQALTAAITELLSDLSQAQVMGENAKRHVSLNYSVQKQAKEYVSLYHSLESSA